MMNQKLGLSTVENLPTFSYFITQVWEVIEDLRDGLMKASELPLVVVKFESKYFTLILGSI